MSYNGYADQDAFHAAMRAAWTERLSTPEGRKQHDKDYGPWQHQSRPVRPQLQLL